MPQMHTPLESGEDSPAKKFFVADVKPQDTVRSTFLVKSKQVMVAKNGRPYLALTLGDRTGTLDCRVWTEDVVQLADSFQEGDVIAVSGKAQLFQNRLQLVIQNLAPVAERVGLDDYLPKAPGDATAQFEQLKQVFEQQLSCPWIRKLSLDLLNHPDVAARYPLAPAAKTIHHPYLGGLVEHSLQLVQIVQAIHPLYPRLNKNILLFGAAFHDFGKIFELSFDGMINYTDEGRLVGHIAIGTVLVDRMVRQIEGFPVELEWQVKHMVLSHHGKIEYGSPVKPQTLEAQLVHHLDDMDSKLNSIQALIDSDRSPGRWTPLHKAYQACYWKPSEQQP